MDRRVIPIGTVRCDIKTPVSPPAEEAADPRARMAAFRDYHRRVEESVSELVIDDAYAAAISGVEGFSHLLVLYWAHRVPAERRKTQAVHPMGRKDIPEQGVFATCSPARPNPILTTVVRLTGRRNNTLQVTGLDAVDGSPVLDIKPYIPANLRVDDAEVPEWVERLHRDLAGDDTEE
jgi:tRNA-Thr(GGU) m(6)t(6)A37 methyltransferase TsaA